MHVPFSMSDEPDLGDEFKGGHERDDRWETEPCTMIPQPSPRFVFHSEEELMSSDFFQAALSKALACKNRQIADLRCELLACTCEDNR